MNDVYVIVKEQINNIGTILRMSKYEEKATYQNHYLGLLWQVLNPLIQIGIYYLIFGIGVNGDRNIDGVPYIIWMIVGVTVWFFLSKSILQASNSVAKQVGLVSKMKFPVSILPSVSIAGQLPNYLWMTLITIVALFIAHIYPTIYWLQYIYYFISMLIFLFAYGLINSTITMLAKDYHIMLQSIFRLLFYISGTIWNFEAMDLPTWFINLLKINPMFYIVNGFRDTFLSREWFWNMGNYTLIFWCITMLMFVIGAHLHLKFRARFVDYI